jgi:hypothetical protein
MSYWDISQMSVDEDLVAREQACAAQELPAGAPPWQWVQERSLLLASQPGWSEAWASAVAGGLPNPGRDPGVITDGMILSAVQLLISSGV